jgi:hypothetical protein
MSTPEDTAGPTDLRLAHAAGFYDLVGRSRSSRRYTMLDDALGRAWKRSRITAEEYSALRRYARHWACGGLLGPMQSVDLNRIYAAGTMSGLSEAQQDHRNTYRAARTYIGTRPAKVADHVACYGVAPREVGFMLGYRSAAHARDAACELLSEAGYRLIGFFRDRDRSR